MASPSTGALADEIAALLRALPLLEADVVLDEARRFAFTKVFSGYSDDSVRSTLRPAEIVLAVASWFHGIDLDETQKAIALARRTLWSAHFAAMPETKFGREFAAYMERVQNGNDAAKLH
jgi:hypothetical protein